MAISPLQETKPSFAPRQLRAIALTLSVSGLVAGVFAIVFYGVLPEQGVWAGHNSGNCEQFCESSHKCHMAVADRPPIYQPINAWTALTYLIAGLWPICNRLDLSTVAFLFGNAYLGFGTFMFHASMTTFWSKYDIAGVVAALTITACHGVHAVFGISWRWLLPPCVILSLCTNFYYPELISVGLLVDHQMIVYIGAMILCTLRLVVARVQQIRSPRARRSQEKQTVPQDEEEQPKICREILGVLFHASLPGLLFFSALGIWLLEVNRAFCNPNGILQGHGIWHVLTAISLLLHWQFCDQNQLADIRSARSGLDESETARTDEFDEDDVDSSDAELGLNTIGESSTDDEGSEGDISV